MTKETGTEIIDKRVGEIALAIARYQSTRREVQFDPSNRKYWEELGKKWGVHPDQAKFFFVRVVLPMALSASTGGMLGGLQGVQNDAEEADCGGIALQILQNTPIEINPAKSPPWLAELSIKTKVEIEELKNFYVHFVLTAIIAKIMGWEACYISRTCLPESNSFGNSPTPTRDEEEFVRIQKLIERVGAGSAQSILEKEIEARMKQEARQEEAVFAGVAS